MGDSGLNGIPPLEISVPPARGADCTPEDRGVARDGVRLLVSRGTVESHHRFYELTELLRRGDLLVVNESATVPASLAARADFGDFRVSLSTAYGSDLWLVEPRWDYSQPGPLPLEPADPLELGGLPGRYVASFPGIPRLGFVHVEGDLGAAMRGTGRPIRYGYLAREYPLETYQTIFARVPGSAEMPSAARPFTRPLLDRLGAEGVGVASIVLHTGVSSLEAGDAGPGRIPIYPEPFSVPRSTVDAIRRTRASGGRVIAIGTTVVRALESATDDCGLRPSRGFTRVVLGPARSVQSVDGLLTGFHESNSTHLALLESVAGVATVRRAYRVAVDHGYLWHEFGDSQLFLPS
ncbi:MAG: S-adenosylmethionine:tRNA ribosyltransferase-isomerase [Thermoplasmata archaeon]